MVSCVCPLITVEEVPVGDVVSYDLKAKQFKAAVDAQRLKAEAALRVASAEYKKLHTMAPETKARSRKHF